MKPRDLRSLTLLAGLLIIAVIVLGLIPLNPGSKAALDRKGNSRFSKGTPAVENLDVRNRFSKTSQKSEALIQKREKKDSRLRVGVPESMLKAKERLEREVPGVEVAFSEEIGAPEIVSIRAGKRMLTGKSAQSKDAIVRGFLTKNKELYGLSLRQIGQLKKIADYTNPVGNILWVEFRQEIQGLPVFQGELRAALNSNGELFRTVGRLVPDLDYAKIASETKIRATRSNRERLAAHASPSKDLTTTAAQAVSIAASSIDVAVDPASLVVKETSADGTSVVFEPGPFAQETKAELVYFPLAPG